MIKEIWREIVYAWTISTIIIYGLIFCDIHNREALWEETYQSWEYNLDPQEGDEFYNAMVRE